MSKLLRAAAATLMISYLAASAATAQQATQVTSPQAPDPNQVVCEKQEVLGSRIATQRICKTRAQWAEDRRLDRMEIDRVQTQRGSCDGKGCH